MPIAATPGVVADGISVDTDFMILGAEPTALRRPTQDELDIDPMAQQRYEKSIQKVEGYNQLLDKGLIIATYNRESMGKTKTPYKPR